MGYNATGFVYMQAENLDELIKNCTSLMQLCPDINGMDVFDETIRKRGTLSREVIYRPASAKAFESVPGSAGAAFSQSIEQ